MSVSYLLPNRFKRLGWFIFIPALLISVLYLFYEWEPEWLDMKTLVLIGSEDFFSSTGPGFTEVNIFNELLGVLIIIGGMLVALSREIDEDELIQKIRLESLLWATIWSYGILLLAIVFVYGTAFFTVMMINMFTVLFFFIVRFNWKLFRLRKSLAHEE